MRLHALSGGASLVGLPEVVPNPYPKALAVSREFAIIRDLASHPFEQGGDRRAARPAVGAAAAAVARRTAQGRPRFQLRRAGALHRNRPAGRAAHRRLHHAGAVAQGDRGQGAARRDAGRARRQPQRARRAAVDAHRCARRARGRRSRVGDRADGAAARRDVDPAARGRRTRPRLREQRLRRRAGLVRGGRCPISTLLTRPWEFQIFDDLDTDAALHFERADQGRDAIGADGAGQDQTAS